MDSMHEIARRAIEQTPPACRVTVGDAAVIAKHADALVAMGPAMSSALYERAGMPEALLARLGDQTIREALAGAKIEFGLRHHSRDTETQEG